DPAAAGACGKRAPEDLTSKLLYTASGSYDAQADVRDPAAAGACGKRAPEDLTSKLLYTASGSYDAQAD
ncbi:hypothetical protein CTI14_72225, partial [Methylobacterium radiotolerans]